MGDVITTMIRRPAAASFTAYARPFDAGPGLCHDGRVSPALVIDVWSDVVCPFCYLGSRQLEVALQGFEHRDEVTIRQRAFELDPNAAPNYDLTLDELLAAKYGMPLERARSLNQRMQNDAAALGMTWSMDRARPSNTFDAHRVIALASTQGLQEQMSQRLFLAYFSEGQLLSDRDTLETLANEIGLNGADELWHGDEFSQDVRADELRAQELGISGVPTFLLDEKFMVVGAQGPDKILDALTRAWERH